MVQRGTSGLHSDLFFWARTGPEPNKTQRDLAALNTLGQLSEIQTPEKTRRKNGKGWNTLNHSASKRRSAPRLSLWARNWATRSLRHPGHAPSRRIRRTRRPGGGRRRRQLCRRWHLKGKTNPETRELTVRRFLASAELTCHTAILRAYTVPRFLRLVKQISELLVCH